MTSSKVIDELNVLSNDHNNQNLTTKNLKSYITVIYKAELGSLVTGGVMVIPLHELIFQFLWNTEIMYFLEFDQFDWVLFDS